MTGPAYARALAAAAARAGAELRLGTTVTGLEAAVTGLTGGDGPDGAGTVTLTSGRGVETVRAAAVLLATGCRERPRAARLIPGDRPAGVMTTGELQQRVYLGHERLPGRALVVGAEHVSLLRRGDAGARGRRVVALVTEHERQQSYAAFRLGAALRWRVPVWTSTAVRRVAGRGTAGRGGGDRRPHRRGAVRAVRHAWSSPATGSPITSWPGWPGWPWIPAPADPRSTPRLETSAPGVFAAGNLVHAAETADIAALSGRHAARHIAARASARVRGTGAGRQGAGRAPEARRGAPGACRCGSSRRCGGSRRTRSRPRPLPRGTGSCCAARSSAGRPGSRCGRTAGCWPGHAWSGWCRGGPCTSTPTGRPGSTRRAVRCASRPVLAGTDRGLRFNLVGFAGGAGDDRTGRPQESSGVAPRPAQGVAGRP